MAVQELLGSLSKDEIYHYVGSLTNPPCSEVVQWFVINEPQPISQAQLTLFRSRFMDRQAFANGNGNNRNTQALNGRTVYYKFAS